MKSASEVLDIVLKMLNDFPDPKKITHSACIGDGKILYYYVHTEDDEECDMVESLPEDAVTRNEWDDILDKELGEDRDDSLENLIDAIITYQRQE